MICKSRRARSQECHMERQLSWKWKQSADEQMHYECHVRKVGRQFVDIHSSGSNWQFGAEKCQYFVQQYLSSISWLWITNLIISSGESNLLIRMITKTDLVVDADRKEKLRNRKQWKSIQWKRNCSNPGGSDRARHSKLCTVWKSWWSGVKFWQESWWVWYVDDKIKIHIWTTLSDDT